MGRGEPFPGNYRSVEHNIDMFAFAQTLGDSHVMDQARKFTEYMYGKNSRFPKSYVVGTHGSAKCDTRVQTDQPISADGQMWNIAAGADSDLGHTQGAVDFALSERDNPYSEVGFFGSDVDQIGHQGQGVGEVYHGLRFSNKGNGIQWEITASSLIAMVKFRQEAWSQGEAWRVDNNGMTSKIKKSRDSIKKLLDVYGSVPSSILGGNSKRAVAQHFMETFPGGSDTGLGWNYFRYPHLASTVWSGLALMQQGHEDESVDSEASPYATPNQAVPAPGNCACLPSEGPGPAPAPVPPPAPAPPAPAPSPAPAGTCNVGDVVQCPGSNNAMCGGSQCCPGGITCPSAMASFHGCPVDKTVDCTGQGLSVVV
jgi:hypothetical protein